MTNETRSADCFGDISCLMQNAHQLRFVIQDRNGHRLPIALEKPAIGTPQVIALCFHGMLAPSLRRDSDGIKQACDAGCILKIRSEEHTSELQSLMRLSYAVFCLKKKKEYK